MNKFLLYFFLLFTSQLCFSQHEIHIDKDGNRQNSEKVIKIIQEKTDELIAILDEEPFTINHLNNFLEEEKQKRHNFFNFKEITSLERKLDEGYTEIYKELSIGLDFYQIDIVMSDTAILYISLTSSDNLIFEK